MFHKPDIVVAKKHAADSIYSYLRTRCWGHLVITAAIIANVPSESNNARVIHSSKNRSQPFEHHWKIIHCDRYIINY